MRLLRLQLSALAAIVGCATAQHDDDRNDAAGYCEQVEVYASPCGAPVGCDAALVRDCAALDGVIASSIERAASSCMGSLGAPMECLAAGVDEATSSKQLEDFAQSFCLACGDGSDGCEADLLQSASGPGRIARTLAPSVLPELA